MTEPEVAALLRACAWPATAEDAIDAIDAGRWQTALRLYGWLAKVGMTTEFDYPSGAISGLNQGQALDALHLGLWARRSCVRGVSNAPTNPPLAASHRQAHGPPQLGLPH